MSRSAAALGFNNYTRYLWFALSIWCALSVANGASRYKSKSKSRNEPQLVYDQRQSGDYNIQVHLKDLQIIAMLGDESLSDYDYDYDLSDFTIKPSGSTSTSTTTQPPSPSTTASPKPSTPNNTHPYPIESVSTLNPTTTKIDANQTVSENVSILTSTESITQTSSAQELMAGGKIKVQILEGPAPTMELAAAPVGIVPGEDVQSDISAGILQGELASYRKCVAGYSRDKKGRCRRVRKPGTASQLFGLDRFASNLATRLRLSSLRKPADPVAVNE